MDGDDERRGGPSVHAAFAREHKSAGTRRELGRCWRRTWRRALRGSSRRARRFDPQRLREGLLAFGRMHGEVVYGQQLDLLHHEDVTRMHELKTGSYTVRGPLRARRLARRRERRATARARALRRAARPGVPAARRLARRVRRSGADRQAGRQRPPRGQAFIAGGRSARGILPISAIARRSTGRSAIRTPAMTRSRARSNCWSVRARASASRRGCAR